ncbi:MAG: hypothetical protein KA368_08145 [Acidobacteria bacterium]|nr:hypothetical protein [Acidobacteriota bacterium]
MGHGFVNLFVRPLGRLHSFTLIVIHSSLAIAQPVRLPDATSQLHSNRPSFFPGHGFFLLAGSYLKAVQIEISRKAAKAQRNQGEKDGLFSFPSWRLCDLA